MAYESDIVDAYNDINEAGESCTLVMQTVGEGGSPWESDISTVEYPCKVLWLASGMGSYLLPNTQDPHYVRKALIAAQGIPQPHELTSKLKKSTGEEWVFDIVNPLAFNTEVILYKCRLSR